MSRPQTFSNGHPADDVLDVDAAVAQRRPFLVGLGDLRSRTRRRPRVRGVPRSCAVLSHVAHCARVMALATHRAHGPGYGSSSMRPRLVAAPARSTPRGGLDEADLAATRSRCSGAGTTTRTRPACTSPTRWWSHRRAATGGRPRGLVLLKGVSDRRASSSSPTPAPARAPSWPRNPRCALLFPWHPLERQVRVDGVAAPLPRRRGRGLLRAAARAAPSSAPGPRTSRSVVAGRERAGGGVRRGGGAVRRRRRAGARGVGRLPSCARRSWSSGRAGRAGCTTGWSTAARRRLGHRAARAVAALSPAPYAHSDHGPSGRSRHSARSFVTKHLFRGNPRLLIGALPWVVASSCSRARRRHRLHRSS